MCYNFFSRLLKKHIQEIAHSEVDLHFLTEVDFTYAHC